MQPLGRKPSRFPKKTDAHLHNGLVNWWEVDMDRKCAKRAERLEFKKGLRKLLDELDEDKPI